MGEAKVGKTSLYTKLDNRDAELPKEEERTRGIDIHRHSFQGKHGDDFIINIWGFGGQDILHATHRFFLTARSLYVLLTATDMNDDNFDYWIPNIHLFGDESPILVVKNIKAGFNRNFSIHRFQKNQAFNLPRQMMEVNLKTCEGFEELKDAIQEHIQQLPQIGQPLPKSWVRVRKALQKEAEERSYFSYEGFKQLANQEGIEEELKVQDVGRFLHEMGVILWYQHLPALKSKVILRPEWATNAVYQIVDDSNVGAHRGHFNRKDVQRVCTKDSYQTMHDELLALMQAFRLCYKKRGKEEYIIPSLLPADPEEVNWDDQNNLTLQYQYDFMPKGIINQLTAQMHDLIRDEASVWSRGMVLEDGGTQALITQDYYQRKLTIQCQGNDARALMRMVMRDLDLVHEGYGGIAFKRRVPCTCSQCSISDTPYIFEYEKLENKLQGGKQRVPCFESEEFVNIHQILFNVGIETPLGFVDSLHKDKTERITSAVYFPIDRSNALDIFISYSKHDKSYLEDLRVSLRPFERKEQIKVWYDGEVEAGAEWDTDIKENLQKADIIIFLVSRDFIKTDYIWDVEIKAAMERHEKKEAVVIPLIIRPCSWTGDDSPFKQLNALPTKGKAISKWEDVDEAWMNVDEGLKKVIEQRLK
ncbi:MAG: COR domain-containing protein [Bacteroidota bacterium]